MSTPADLAIRISMRQSAAPNLDAERAAFDAIVTRDGPALHALANRLAGSGADADDIVQETFLRAWRGIRRFRGDAAPRTWLFRILGNVFRDRVRKRTAMSLDGENPPSSRTEPGAQTARREILGRVLCAVDGLPRRQRECLLLRARGGLSYREIAEVMGIRRSAVRSTLVQARRRLVRRLGPAVRDLGVVPR